MIILRCLSVGLANGFRQPLRKVSLLESVSTERCNESISFIGAVESVLPLVRVVPVLTAVTILTATKHANSDRFPSSSDGQTPIDSKNSQGEFLLLFTKFIQSYRELLLFNVRCIFVSSLYEEVHHDGVPSWN